MTIGNGWSVLNVRLCRAVPLAVATASIAFSGPAQATGTPAGSTITNTATATYTNGGGATVSVPSNPVVIRVDELLDVTVASADPGTPPQVTATAGSVNQVLTFLVTNTGNGQEKFGLTSITALGGDQFDPVTTSIVLDSNNNGTYEPGVDAIYNPGSNDPDLAPNTTMRVFVLSTIPGSAVDTNRGQSDLVATALTGSGTPGTSFAGAGTGGGDAVVGASTAAGRAQDNYVVSSASVTFVKSASVLDPFGGSKAVPNAVITYSLVATVSGSGSLANLAVSDPVPASTTYQPGTLTLQSSPLTDASADDAGEVAGGTAVAVRFGTVPAGQTRTVTFKTKIN